MRKKTAILLVAMSIFLNGSAVIAQVSGKPLGEANLSAGSWTIDEDVDEMSDFRRPIASVTGQDGSMLVVKCDEPGKRSVYVQLIVPEFLGGSGTGYDVRTVKYRFDGGQVIDDAWRYSDNYAFATEGQFDHHASKFIEILVRSVNLVIRIKSYRNEVYDHKFVVTGASKVIARVYDGCRDPSLH